MRRTSYVCAALTVVAALTILAVGWALDVEAIRSVARGAASMKPPSALMLILSGVALALVVERPSGRRLWAVRGLAAVVIALSAVYLGEYLFAVSGGIDELVFKDTVAQANGAAYPGRPAPLTLISFVLVACALLTIDARRRPTGLLIAPVAAINAMCVVGYLYSIPAFYGPATAAKMSLTTALVFLVLAAGVLLARPRGRLQAFLTTDSPGGIMARPLLPLAIAVPLLLGWLHLVGEHSGLFGDRTGTWWQTAGTIVCLVLVIGFAARSLNRGVLDAQRRFETAFEHAPMGIALVDLNGRVMKVNRLMSETTGHDAPSLVATPFSDLIHPDDRGEYQVAARQLMYEGGASYTIERRYVRRDGSELWARQSATLVRGSDDRPQHFIVQVQDITGQREDAEALAAAKQELQDKVKRLQELDQLKEEFVALVTHELRTPLTSVAGYLDIVLEDDDEDVVRLDPQHAHHVGVARRNTQRLIDLVEDLLLIRRLEAGREQLSPQTLDLSDLAADRLESVAPMASAKGVTIGGDVAPGIVVDADPRRIAQIVDNLLSNAIKYTPAGGDVRLTLAPAGDRVALAVADTGIGIPEVDRPHLFDPFFRASNVSGSAVPGTGLGLVVTRRLIEAHGGTVDVESTEGFGSRFVVTLPSAAYSGSSYSAMSRPIAGSKTRTPVSAQPRRS
jgi:PAS domain S-box-containing protein